jgi:hypothetical protein
MIGHVEVLDVGKAEHHWKQSGLDFSELFHRPDVPHAIRHCQSQTLASELERVLDQKLLRAAVPALERGERIEIAMPIHNTDRTLGAILGSEVSRRYGEQGLPEDTIWMSSRAAQARASARSARAASRSRSRATPTTTPARACAARRSSCACRRARPSIPRRT